MANGERALLNYNREFMECFTIAFDPKRLRRMGKCEIAEKDVVALCNAINEMNLSELKCGGRNLWYITSQLLFGTILYYQVQVNLVLDESQMLQQSVIGPFVIMQQTQTIKRRTQEIRTKNKRKRVVDEEITTKVFVWNSNEFQQEENDESALSELEQPDPCMRSQREITLHERDELAENDDRHVLTQIDDFGGCLSMTPTNDEEAESILSEMSDSPRHELATNRENDANKLNIDAANVAKISSCESIPATYPIRRALFTTPLVTDVFDDVPDNVSINGPAVKSVTSDKLALPAKGILKSTQHNAVVPSTPTDDYISESPSSEATRFDEVNNNSLTLDAGEANTIDFGGIPNGILPPPSPIVPNGITPPPSPIVDDIPVRHSLIDSEPIDIIPPLVKVECPIVGGSKRKRITSSAKKTRKLAIDDVTMTDITETLARIANTKVDCKKRRADVVSKIEMLAPKEALFFKEPIMVGRCNRNIFRPCSIPDDTKIDLSIIRAILDIEESDETDGVEKRGCESQVVEGDAILRRSSRKRNSPVGDLIAQNGLRMEMQPSPDLFVQNESPRSASNALETECSGCGEQPQKSAQTAAFTSKVHDAKVLRKLRTLWKQNDLPVTMAHITSSGSNRLSAAKNFASILSLKKLGLIEVKASNDGVIQHIGKVNNATFRDGK